MKWDWLPKVKSPHLNYFGPVRSAGVRRKEKQRGGKGTLCAWNLVQALFPFKCPTGLSLRKPLIVQWHNPFSDSVPYRILGRWIYGIKNIVSTCFYHLFSFFSAGFWTSKTCLTLKGRNVYMRNILACNHSILLE